MLWTPEKLGTGDKEDKHKNEELIKYLQYDPLRFS